MLRPCLRSGLDVKLQAQRLTWGRGFREPLGLGLLFTIV